MKPEKLFIAFIQIVACFYFIGNAHAQDQPVKDQPVKKTPPPTSYIKNTFPYVFLQLFGESGITYPGGAIARTEKDEPQISNAFGAGVSAGYIFSEDLGLTASLEYQKHKYVINRTFYTNPLINTYNFEFINTRIGYYRSWRFLYGEAGLFYGCAVFDWKVTDDYNGEKQTRKISESKKQSVFGIYYGAGCFFDVSEDIYFKAGIRFENALLPAYKGNDKINTNTLMITAGIEKRISIGK